MPLTPIVKKKETKEIIIDPTELNFWITSILKGKQQVNSKDLRFLVDSYYQIQEDRKRVDNQERPMPGETVFPLKALIKNLFGGLEDALKKVMEHWTDDDAGRWAKSQIGIGPVIAAGLRAYIDIKRCPYAGHIWSYAGITGKIKWLGKEGATEIVNQVMGKEKEVTTEHFAKIEELTGRRAINMRNLFHKHHEEGKRTKANLIKTLAKPPWNQSLKNLCWKIGDCFVKNHNNPECFYGVKYAERKELETGKNSLGEYEQYAKINAEKCSKGTEPYKWGIKGMLNPGHIDNRARRYAVKLFLAHWHHVAYIQEYGRDPPSPYPIAMLGHGDFIAPPMQKVPV